MGQHSEEVGRVLKKWGRIKKKTLGYPPVLGVPACGGDLKLLVSFELKILNTLWKVNIVF